MPNIIIWGNRKDLKTLPKIPPTFVPEKLFSEPLPANPRLAQRQGCRQLGYLMLEQALKLAQINLDKQIKIERTLSGRPFLAIPNLDFNLSHSGDYVALILSYDEPNNVVGIDIEVAKERNFPDLLAHFTPLDEQQWLAEQSDKMASFYRCWCLREGILKSQGVGIVKLSEVRHLPLEQRIFSAYCPKGELIFSQQFPFYLAVFSADNNLQNLNCFQWQKGTLQPFQLQQPIYYQVN